MTKHTPGPWKIRGHFVEGGKDYKTVIAEIVGKLDRFDVQADIRLIAAAPEMLEALKEVDEAINPPDKAGISLHTWNERLKVAEAGIRAAIAKATGEKSSND